jgi:predicted SAM-dependent methyltransferase
MNSNKIVLDLGCGKKKRAGSIGVDWSDRHDADVVHDLNIFPYRFDEQTIDKIYIDNTLEHLESPLSVMEELYRIVKPGGVVKVIVPYFRSVSAFIDPTHKHFFTVESFSYYDPDHVICKRYDYTLSRFKAEKIVFHEYLNSGLIKRLIVIIANKWPLKYESYLSNLIPLDEISYYLRRL